MFDYDDKYDCFYSMLSNGSVIFSICDDTIVKLRKIASIPRNSKHKFGVKAMNSEHLLSIKQFNVI